MTSILSFYECKRCSYKCTRNSDMIRHLNRKIKCPRSIEALKYSEDEIYNLSLINNKIKKNVNNDEIIPKKKDLSKKVLNICNICNICNKSFTRLDNLMRHEKKICKKTNNLELITY